MVFYSYSITYFKIKQLVVVLTDNIQICKDLYDVPVLLEIEKYKYMKLAFAGIKLSWEVGGNLDPSMKDWGNFTLPYIWRIKLHNHLLNICNFLTFSLITRSYMHISYICNVIPSNV